MTPPYEKGRDYVFEIAQTIRKKGIKEWPEKRKEEYWKETARICWDSERDKGLIEKFSSVEFKKEIGDSHVFSHGLGIGFGDIDKHYGTMRAGAAHILRERNPDLFKRAEVM